MTQPKDLPSRCEVLVLGAGMAGHCAALAAAEAGADVLLLEKAAQPGGSSAMAGGIFLFTGTNQQKAAGGTDSLQALRRDLLEAGRHKNNPDLVNLYVESQLEAYEFLRDHGVKFQLAPAKPPAPARSHHTGTGRSTAALHEAALISSFGPWLAVRVAVSADATGHVVRSNRPSSFSGMKRVLEALLC